MKYVEPIKSIILTFLVLLSISLTFIIWSYEPEYEFLEDPDVQQVAIGEEKSINDIVRPYKALYRFDETLRGTVSVSTIDETMEYLASLEIGNIRVAKQKASVYAINKLMNNEEQTILFFNTTIPLETLNVILKFNQNNVENVQFDRIIINTINIKGTQTIELLFINTQTNVIYRAAATVNDEEEVDATLKRLVKKSIEYDKFKRLNELDLYLPKNSTDVTKYTYFIGEISQDLLKGALFTDASILQKKVEGNLEKYNDGMSSIAFDTSLKTVNYYNASAENGSIEPAAKLVSDTFNFVNDHGGFNADFRLNVIDPAQKLVDYQLFFQGHPVYSTTTLTRISTTWGDNRIFGYRRPYYEFETDITTEKTTKELSPGVEVIEQLNNQIASANSIDDVVIGYLLVQDPNTRLIVLEPNWFAISSNSWTRITPPGEGSVSNGLE